MNKKFFFIFMVIPLITCRFLFMVPLSGIACDTVLSKPIERPIEKLPVGVRGGQGRGNPGMGLAIQGIGPLPSF